ncbi:very short patch repair endonuclease [Hungatella effluvii]|uniref:very short patch repair endonuclease n=1 Tax=Hungatella effluvii TaxID=1096246 RepID=UPI000D7512B9|nr:very short patch repair endonuclease [Hungatella effluvii]
MDVLNSEQRSKNMKNIKSSNTSIELCLRKALWKSGIRYRKNYKKLPGKPDIAITKYKIAIFCDGEFFHGKDWEGLRKRLSKGDRADYWINKIEKNMERDRNIDLQLRNLGWKVIRFWGKDINKNSDMCVKVIKEAIFAYIMENDL